MRHLVVNLCTKSKLFFLLPIVNLPAKNKKSDPDNSCFVIKYNKNNDQRQLTGYPCKDEYEFMCEFETKIKLKGKILAKLALN